MADRMPDDDESLLRNLPKWPEEARDLREPAPRREPHRRFLWVYVGAILGALGGQGRALGHVLIYGQTLPISSLIRTAIGTAICCACLGLLVDEIHFRRKRRWKDN
jgi:hypothetical protein